ncbi:MAG TPA: tetratricopeptide repeat protein [Thermoguttaceae bacterium]|nr:tetratricopeptide repeat protein [Thermoguttaceae bacterium]
MQRSLADAKSVAAVSLSLILLVGCSQPRQEGSPSSAPDASGDAMLRADAGDPRPAGLEILSPLDEALFPPDIVAPTFRWKDGSPDSDTWLIAFRFSDGGKALEFRSRRTEWTVPDEAWEIIQGRSREQEARVTVSGVRGASPEQILSQASVRIRTSEDEVGAPLFFREVNLPFLKAVKNPAAYIRWRFGPISSKEPPPIVLEKLPVCGNCHSFSADGSTLAMEVDSGNDKGSYTVAPIETRIVLDESKIFTWNDYRREDGEPTFGLLCQVSPDGRHVVGTVKDRALAVYRPDLMFSQLFFLVKGILAIYDRQAKTFHALPGADDPRFVQTNATWSPDGKTLVFARCEAYEPEGLEDVKTVLVPQECAKDFLEGKRTFRYDLYRIPFNGGQGGKAEPIQGASQNGMSNYFPKLSPDGKWIVFCKAKSFMLLQPDSELYIIPAQGGRARRLRCNTSRMNSWHSWSPNGKWLVFSSKMYSPYTQLFLTHVDEQGRSSVPVVLSRFTEPERAANIPEFVNAEPDAIERITARFLDDHHYYRAAAEFIKQRDVAGALPMLQKSLEINPDNTAALLALGIILRDEGKNEEAKAHFTRILEIQPDHAKAHRGLADMLRMEGKPEEAVDHYRQALKTEPSLHEVHASLGLIFLETGKLDEALEHLAEAVRLEPGDPVTNFYCGHVLYRQGKPEEAVSYYRRAMEQSPELVPAMLELASIRLMVDRPELYNLDEALALAKKACDATRHRDPIALKTLAGAYAVAGRFDDAVSTARNALEIALAAGDQDLANGTRKMLDVYEKLQADERERSR